MNRWVRMMMTTFNINDNDCFRDYRKELEK